MYDENDIKGFNEEFVTPSEEEWKNVPYLSPHIQVSSQGRIRKFITLTEWIVLPTYKANEYEMFSYEGKSYAVHRLVAEAFLSEYRDASTSVVKHKNGVKDDNRVDNLEWASSYENLKNRLANAIYCEKMDTLYDSVFSATILLGLPSTEIVSAALKAHKPICGYLLEHVQSDDPRIVGHKVMKITKQQAIEAGIDAQDYNQFFMVMTSAAQQD